MRYFLNPLLGAIAGTNPGVPSGSGGTASSARDVPSAACTYLWSLLCGLEETGLLTKEEAATKLAQLCDWHGSPRTPRLGGRCDASRRRTLHVARPRHVGLRADFIGVLNHVGAVVRLLVQDSAIPDVAIGAFVGVWIDYATARADTPLPARQLVEHIGVHSLAVEKRPIQAARRLWSVYFGLVEAVHHGPTGPKAIGLALAHVAPKAGALNKRMAKECVTSQSTIGERRMMGLDFNSKAWVTFSAA